MSLISAVLKPGSNILVGKKTCECLSLQFVRFRKPRYLPKAPSKLYIVRKPTPQDPVETKLMMEWTQHYNTNLKSLRLFLAKALNEKKKGVAAAKALVKAKEQIDDWHEVERSNNEWNERIKALREKRQNLEKQLKEDLLMQMAKRDEEARLKMKKKAEELVLEAKAEMETYIRPENLDEEIEKVLDSKSDYDFVLTPDGKIRKKSDSNRILLTDQDMSKGDELNPKDPGGVI